MSKSPGQTIERTIGPTRCSSVWVPRGRWLGRLSNDRCSPGLWAASVPLANLNPATYGVDAIRQVFLEAVEPAYDSDAGALPREERRPHAAHIVD